MSRLPFHEWLIICLFVIILLILAFITLVRKTDRLPQVSSTHELSLQTIEVSIKGAVNKPGSYEFKKGALLKDLLELAEALPEADLNRVKTEAKLRNGQQVIIPAQRWITVYVQGAVEQPQALKIKLGTPINQIPSLLTLLPEADIRKLKAKRRLKDQEVIEIPLKKKPQKKQKIKV